MRIAVFGAGYVGLVTGACFADLGHDVVVRDIVVDKIDMLRGMNIAITTTAKTDDEARSLLAAFRFPFKH